MASIVHSTVTPTNIVPSENCAQRRFGFNWNQSLESRWPMPVSMKQEERIGKGPCAEEIEGLSERPPQFLVADFLAARDCASYLLEIRRCRSRSSMMKYSNTIPHPSAPITMKIPSSLVIESIRQRVIAPNPITTKAPKKGARIIRPQRSREPLLQVATWRFSGRRHR